MQLAVSQVKTIVQEEVKDHQHRMVKVSNPY